MARMTWRQRIGALIGGFDAGQHHRRLRGFRATRAHVNALIAASGPDITEALLAQIAVSKHSEHMPLNRQAVVMARHGVPIDRSVLADWVKTGPGGINPSSGRIEGMNARSAGRAGPVR